MIEISIWKILLVLVVALIVLGPEKLPKMARMIGQLIRQLRNSISSVQTELNALTQQENNESSKDQQPKE